MERQPWHFGCPVGGRAVWYQDPHSSKVLALLAELCQKERKSGRKGGRKKGRERERRDERKRI